VTATAIPTRMIVLLGAVLAAAAMFLVARPLLLSDDDSGSSAPPATATPAAPAPATPSKASTTAKPKIVILPDVPKPLATKLRFSKVVVASVYSGTSKSDRAAVAQARAGAKEVGAGFVALNVLDEATARQVQPFAGTASAPVVLVVKRPGKIATRFDTAVDSALVAQAARNAGAGR